MLEPVQDNPGEERGRKKNGERNGTSQFQCQLGIRSLIPFMKLHPHISVSATLFLVRDGSRYSPYLTISMHYTGTIGTQIFLSILGGRHQVSSSSIYPKDLWRRIKDQMATVPAATQVHF